MDGTSGTLPMPPVELRRWVGPFDDASEFADSGKNTVRALLQMAGLRSDDAILDVGCGAGRVALPLMSVLDDDGRYEGFDICVPAVDWCRAAITSRRPNFLFHAIEARNEAYESPAAPCAAEVSFPFPSASFDLVIVTSVFTHMLGDALDNYLSEAARVLRSGGRMFVSLFLLDDVSEAAIRAGRAKLDFRHPFGAMRALNTECPEEGLAIERADFLERLRRHAFAPDGPIHLGSWRDASTGCGNVYFQDLLVARKAEG
jgi:SAM-dependent methyltransferase